MRRVSLNGVSYSAPFERLLPPHTSASLAALEADILLRRRVLLPVVTYLSPAHGRAVLDGVTRAALAERHEIPDVPVDDWGEMPDEWAAGMCLALNAARRQISPADHAEVVLRMRKAGETIRGIAAVTMIPRGRVARIIEGAGLPTYPLRPALFDDDDEGGEAAAVAPRHAYEGPEPPLAMEMPANIEAVAFTDNLQKMQAALTTASTRGKVLIASDDPRGERLRKLARKHGVPLGRGESWPALEAIREALADLQEGE